MIKQYKKDCDYSYTGGFYPTFELIKKHADKIRCIYVNEDALNSDGYKLLKTKIDERKIILSSKVFDKLKEKDNDHVIGVFDKYEEELDASNPHVVLVNPSDQGNLGNIMRSMLAFGYKDLAIITPAADRFNPKVVRSSMGAFFSIRQETFTSFEEYQAKYHRDYYPFMLKGATFLKEVSKPQGPYALVFGNEATGLPDSFTNEHATKIEQSDDVDSLNLATAVVVALYEFKNNK